MLVYAAFSGRVLSGKTKKSDEFRHFFYSVPDILHLSFQGSSDVDASVDSLTSLNPNQYRPPNLRHIQSKMAQQPHSTSTPPRPAHSPKQDFQCGHPIACAVNPKEVEVFKCCLCNEICRDAVSDTSGLGFCAVRFSFIHSDILPTSHKTNKESLSLFFHPQRTVTTTKQTHTKQKQQRNVPNEQCQTKHSSPMNFFDEQFSTSP